MGLICFKFKTIKETKVKFYFLMKNIFHKIKLLLFSPTNLYIKTFTLLIFIFVGVFYFHYNSLKEEKFTTLNVESLVIEKSIKNSFKVYKEILSILSNKITNDRDRNTKNIEFLLKQFYLASNQGNVIPFDNITWHDHVNNLDISKYGKLRSKIIFSKETENAVQNSENVSVVRSDNKRSLSGHDKIYAVLRVQDHKKQYIGYLSLHIDIERWLFNIQNKIHDKGLILSIADKISNKVGFATETQIESISFTNMVSQCKFNKNINLTSSNYSFILGYKKQFFWDELFSRFRPQVFIGIISFATFSLFLFLNKRKINDHYYKKFKHELEALSNICSKYTQELELLKNNYQQNENFFESELSNKNKELECYKVSYNEKAKLASLHHNKVVRELENIRTLIAQLSEMDIGSPVNLSVFEKNSIIAELNSKVQFLPYITIDDNDILDIEATILSVRNIYLYDLLGKEIDFSYKIAPKIRTLKFNSLLFIQALSSFVYLCLDAAKRKGFIKIEVSKIQENQKELILIKIKDNGFYLDKDVGEILYLEKKNSFSYPLEINLDLLRAIFEQQNCDYIISFNDDIKTQELYFYQEKEEDKNNATEVSSSNVIKLRNNKKQD